MRGEDDKRGDGGNLPLSKTEADFIDLQNESAGRATSRIRRFLPEEARPDRSGKRAERESGRVSALLSLLQSDPEYAALYGDTLNKLREAEAATALVLSRATTALDQARTDLANALDGASTLADGTRVFRDQNGDVWTDDGRRVEDDELDQFTWRDGAVSYEEFLARKKAAAENQRTVEGLLKYQVDVLGNARDRLMDEDNPPSKEELEQIQQEINDKAPPAVRETLKLDKPEAAHHQTASNEIEVPKL